MCARDNARERGCECVAVAMPPPTFLCVQCMQCGLYQVQRAKKAGAVFTCSTCGLKQAIRKVFAMSAAAKDCREVAVALNSARGEAHARD